MSQLCFCGRNNDTGSGGMCREHSNKWIQEATKNPKLTFEEFKRDY